MFSSTQTRPLAGRRRSPSKLSSSSAADKDDKPDYPVKGSWVMDSSGSFKLAVDAWGRLCWLNEATGQWTYQINNPTAGLATSPHLMDTAGMLNPWVVFPAMPPENRVMNGSVGPFGPVIFYPPWGR